MVGDGLGEAEVETDGEALGEAEEVALAEGEALAVPDTDMLGVGDGEAASPGSWGISKVAQTVRKNKVFLKVDRLGLIT